MKRATAPGFLVLALVAAAACGSVTPLGTGAAGTSGSGQAGSGASAGTTGAAGTTTTGAAGVTGAAGTNGSAGTTTGAAGVTGAAGANGSAGTTGAGGGSGRVPMKHRAAASICPMDRPAGRCDAVNTVDAGAPQLMCKEDADCGAGKNGRCIAPGRIFGCVCSYDECFRDADCGQTGGPCDCRGTNTTGGSTANLCKAGNCRVDRDCGAAGYCSPSLGSCGNFGGVVGYYCHTPKDKCVDDGDCAAQGGGDCRFNQVMGAWLCETSQCAG